MENLNKILLTLIFGIICFCLGSWYGREKSDKQKVYKTVEFFDTTYNKVVFDSIEYNIRIKDSTIIKLKKKVEYEIEQAINSNDSDAVKQFYELAGTN